MVLPVSFPRFRGVTTPIAHISPFLAELLLSARSKCSARKMCCAKVEATTGIEPVNSGFADRRLTTWLRGHVKLGYHREFACKVSGSILSEKMLFIKAV